MNSDKKESLPVDESRGGTDAAGRALASEAWFFWGMVGIAAFIVAAVLYWVGVLKISPLHFLEWVGRVGAMLVGEDPSASGAAPSFIAGPMAFFRDLLAGLSWAFMALPWLAYVRYSVGVIEAGSKEAYWQRRREKAELASVPVPVGLLEGISIAKGGLLSSNETLVETTEGFFRVQGLVDTVKKGVPVFTLGSQLLIGEGRGQKRYTLVS